MQELLNRFSDFVKERQLFSKKDLLLLAVSGGVDSVALVSLCAASGYSCRIAHMNFQLRGPESDRDEAFVRALAKKFTMPVIVQKTDTAAFADKQKISIQLAARQLRYQWFEELLQADLELKYLLTAHHEDDNIETLLMHFFRGTGIHGLSGIPLKQRHIIRPLLFAKKQDILDYARDQSLEWVEDSSNDTEQYTRNYVRHSLIPAIRQVYPEVQANLAGNIQRLGDTALVFDEAIARYEKQFIFPQGNELHIPVLKLKKMQPLATIVYELMKAYHFTAGQTGDIVQLLDSDNGKYVASETHRVIRNRAWLVIAPIQGDEPATVLVEEGMTRVNYPKGVLQLTFEPVTEKLREGLTNTDPQVAWLDAAKISYPLLLRRAKTGDYFYPLGMTRKKKLARFLIDQKLSKTAKEQVWVLEMDQKIVWAVGMRIDHRYRLMPGTKNILRITNGGDAIRSGNH